MFIMHSPLNPLGPSTQWGMLELFLGRCLSGWDKARVTDSGYIHQVAFWSCCICRQLVGGEEVGMAVPMLSLSHLSPYDLPFRSPTAVVDSICTHRFSASTPASLCLRTFSGSKYMEQAESRKINSPRSKPHPERNSCCWLTAS